MCIMSNTHILFHPLTYFQVGFVRIQEERICPVYYQRAGHRW